VTRLSQINPLSKSQSPKIIICLSSTHWHFLWQRPQQIMSRVCRDYRVLFVDPPYAVSQAQLIREGGKAFKVHRPLNSVNKALQVLSPVQILASDSRFGPRQLQRVNLQLVKGQIQQALAALRWDSPRLLWVYNPQAVTLVGQLGEAGVIYDCVDSFSDFSWSNHNTAAWEAELVQKADLILTSATQLYRNCQDAGKPVYLIPNAADYQHFSKSSNYGGIGPSDLKAIPHPRLGFCGAIYEWLDFDLLRQLAAEHSQWQMVMIGPLQPGLAVPESLSNLHWLGRRDYQQLPWYLAHLDLMMIPFLKNKVTEHANPIKLWEYLAAGKAVVATDLPEVPRLGGVTWISTDYPQFQANCAAVLELVKTPEKRNEIAARARLVAKENSWEQRCRQILQILRERF
jgi:glycosyltransferase involved in cell wall biosynthesis